MQLTEIPNQTLWTVVIGTLVLTVFVLSKWWQITHNPLKDFPGPWSARFSNLHHSRLFIAGRQPFELLKLHEKYGPVVRTAPNDLSFISSQSWRDIYVMRKGHLPFIKSQLYDGGDFAGDTFSVVNERDPARHAEMRKYLSSAFSDRSLREQEFLIAEVVDEMITKIGKVGETQTDLAMWYNLTNYDIIGSLAFGKTFEGVASGSGHPWISTIIKGLSKGAIGDCMNRFPILAWMATKFLSKQVEQMMQENRDHEMFARKLVEDRISRKTTRKDLITNILEARLKIDISDTQISAHASAFVIAGSETTATALACATYFLARDPAMTQKLQTELDRAFKVYDDIDATSSAGLQYLTAICKEAMRIYPPLPLALPRIVPKGGDTVDGYFIPEGTVVSTAPFAASMSTANFHEPWTFSPERWIEKNETDDLDASQPFSLGPRSCMGRSMGWMEMRTILAKVYWKYDVELTNTDMDWHRDSRMYTLWKKPALLVRLRARQR